MNNSNGSELHSDDLLDMVNIDMRMAVLPVTILIGFENVVGLIGNSLILLVYSRTYEKSNFRCFVLIMAFIDLASCLTCVPGEIFTQLNWYKFEHDWVCKVKCYFTVFGAWGSASILFILSIDRYRKICRPLGSQIQKSLAFKLCLVAVIGSAFVSLVSSFRWGKQTYIYQEDELRVKVTVCERSSVYAEKKSYPVMYILFILPIGLMMMTVTTLNVLTTKKLFCVKQPALTESLSVSTLNTARSNSDPTNKTNTGSCSSVEHLETYSYNESKTDGHTRNDKESVVTAIRLSDEMESCDQHDRKVSATCLDENDITLIPHGGKTAPQDQLNMPWYTKASSQSNEPISNRFKKVESSKMPDVKSVSASGSRLRANSGSVNRKKRKTIIMLVLTTAFNVTMSVYVILVSLVAEKNTLQTLTNSEKAIYFFFLRLYFINYLINPFLYGVMDPRFRNGVREMFCWKLEA